MEEFQPYAPEEVILDNLEELRLRTARTQEQELAHLCELAEEIAEELSNHDAAALIAALPEHRLPPPHIPDEPRRNSAFSSVLDAQEDNRRRVLLALELHRRLPDPQLLLNDLTAPPSDSESETLKDRISYQKNSYTDLAYEQFATLLDEPSASYAHSFPSVCEEVFNGLCEYCILPLENSTEGRLSSFSRLIAEHDLKIAATCEIQTGEERSTRFALLRRTPIQLPTNASQPQYFDCIYDLSPSFTPEHLFFAAHACGLIVHRAELLSKDRNTEEQSLHLVLKVTKNALISAFLLYLAMEAPNTNLVGIYPNLSYKKRR